MTTRIGSRLAVSLASFIALAAFACSSAPPGSDLGQGDSKDKTPAPKTPAGTTKPGDTTKPAGDTTKPPVTPLGDDGACGKKADLETCEVCCIEKAPDAYKASGKIYYDCLCAPAACATQCAESVCAAAETKNEPTAACKTCLDAQDKACGDKAGTACDAVAACKAVDACLVAQCAPKQPKDPQP